LRILVLTHEFPPIGGGGAQVIRDLCRGMTFSGHEIQVLTTHIAGLPFEEKLDSVRIIRVPCGRQAPYRARLVEMAQYLLRGFPIGLGLIKNWRPDIMHVHFAVPAGALGKALSMYTGVPYFMTVHGGDVPGGAPEKTSRWFRWIYPFTHSIWRSASHVVAVSEHTRQLSLRHYPVEISVIRNGFDFAALRPGEIEVGRPPQVIWAGRFMPEKNPLQVVNTMNHLRDIPWKCVMIGDGPERARVEREIVKWGLQERFTIPGWVDQKEVMNWFARSDVLFMPSLSEGLPIVGLQGLAMGLAVVATRVGGFVDLVDPMRNGYLVDNPNSDGFTEPLRRLLTDPEQLLKFRRASFLVADRFDISYTIQSYEELLTELASKLVKPDKFEGYRIVE